MRSSDDVKIAKANEFNETGTKGAKSKHAVVEVVEIQTGQHYFDKPEPHQWIAQSEVIAQELNRATYPNNPRTIYKLDKDGVHVLSERVEGFKSLHELINEHGGRGIVADKIKKGEFKNFGTCIVIALKSNEADLHTGNIGIDKNNNFIKIDADWSNGRVRYGESKYKFNITEDVISSLPMLDTDDYKPFNWFDQVEEGGIAIDNKFITLADNDRVQNEINAQLLRSMLLPPDCIRTIVRANTIDRGEAQIQLNEHLKSRLQLMKSTCVEQAFCAYLKTDAAKQVMQDYVKQLQDHQLTNNKNLGDPAKIEKDVNEIFGQVQTLAATSKKDNKEAWYANYTQMVTATTNDSKKEKTAQLFLAIESRDAVTTKTVTKHQPELINAKNADGRTPLLQTARRGFFSGFKTLRKAKSDMAEKDLNDDNGLTLAARSGNKEIAEIMLKSKQVDINAVNKEGKSAVMQAAENGNEDVLDLLISKGADLTTLDNEQVSALVYAAGGGHSGCADLLLQRDEVKNNKEQIRSAFITAVHNKEFDTAYDLIKSTGMEIYLENKSCVQYLRHVAAHYGDDVLLTQLLAKDKSNLDLALADGSTALSLAVDENHPDCLDILMKSGAVSKQDARDALLAAVEDNKTDAAKVLIENNVGVNFTSQEQERNYTPLMNAIKNGNDELTDLILLKSNKAAINHVANNQSSAFTKAFEYGNEKAVIKLLNHHLFDLTPYKDSLHTGLLDACQDGRFDLANVLLANGANINYADPNRNGETPLMLAVRNGNDRFINMMMNHHKLNSIDVKNNNGETAADIALQNGDHKLYVKLTEISKQQAAQAKKVVSQSTTSKMAVMMAGGAKDTAKSNLQKQPEPQQQVQPPQATGASANTSSSSADSKNVAVYTEGSSSLTSSEDANATSSFRKIK